MTKVVLDTNVLASGYVGFLHPGSIPGQILHLWRERVFELVVSDHILMELAHTFEEPYFRNRLSPELIERDLTLLREEATFTELAVTVQNVATHPEDDLVLATAASARADYLVTGDKKLQKLGIYQGVVILSPRAYLDHFS